LSDLIFKPAQRKSKPIIAAMTGFSGSGKTWSALLLMRGIVGPEGRIAVIDTEAGSSELYEGLTGFDVLQMPPPYTPERYIEYIDAAKSQGYDGLIIDSFTHVWSGEGGATETHDKMAMAKPALDMLLWSEVKPPVKRLTDYIKSTGMHVIVTYRMKDAYEKEGADKVPKHVGSKIDGLKQSDYEFDIVFELQAGGQHLAIVTDKNRFPMFKDGLPFLITTEHGELLKKWRDSGAAYTAPITDVTRGRMQEEARRLGATTPAALGKAYSEAAKALGIPAFKKTTELSEESGNKIFKYLKDKETPNA
jgi:hypothetical protein